MINVIEREGVTTKFLSTNYRSTQVIVRAADSVIKNNKNRITKDSDTINEFGDKSEGVYTHNNATESEYICKKIQALMEKDTSLKYSDFCVLARTQHQIDRLEEQFLLSHIPFRSKGQVPFYCRAEIKDILAYLKFSYNEHDLVSLARIINVPKRGIGPAALKNLLEQLQNNKLSDIIGCDKMWVNYKHFTKKQQISLRDFIKLVDELKNLISNNSKPADVVNCIVNNINYKEHLKSTVKVAETLEEKLTNIEQLKLIAATYDSIEAFLTNATLDEPELELEKDALNKVSLMTMHSSKGLEFKVVFIAGAHDESVPFVKSHDNPDAIQEERRLMYVSMTRAEKKLIITCPRVITGQLEIQKTVVPSRFLKEIPEDYIAKYKY